MLATKTVNECVFLGLKILEIFLVTGQDELELIGRFDELSHIIVIIAI